MCRWSNLPRPDTAAIFEIYYHVIYVYQIVVDIYLCLNMQNLTDVTELTNTGRTFLMLDYTFAECDVTIILKEVLSYIFKLKHGECGL